MAKNTNDDAPTPPSFKSPTELSHYRELQQQKRITNREADKGKKIWEKTTSATRTRTVRPVATWLSEIPHTPEKKEVAQRRKGGSPLRKYINDTRDVFLAEFCLNAKKDQINSLQAQSQLNGQKLKAAELSLDTDIARFDAYLRENDEKSHQAMKEAEELAKQKQEKTILTQTLKGQISAIQSENSKLKDQKDEYEKYKNFLVALTPSDWFDSQREKNEAQKNRRQQKIAERKLRLSNEGITEEPTDDEDSSSDESEIYFESPKQLLDIFRVIEEQNCFLIQNVQESEQALETIEKQFSESEKSMTEQADAILCNIAALERQVENDTKRVNKLKEILASKRGRTDAEAAMKLITQQIEDIYTSCGYEVSSNGTPIKMLEIVETRLESLLVTLDQHQEKNGEALAKLEKEKEKERREIFRQIKLQMQESKNDEKLLASTKTEQNVAVKKFGKPIMFRSYPVVKNSKEVEENLNESEADRHFYFFFS